MSVWESVAGLRAAQGVRRQVAGGDHPHAWLFLGPRGSGKRATARALAAALTCTVEERSGCGSCDVCRRVMRGTFPDVHTILPEGNFILTDTVRDEVIIEAGRSPFEGKCKVFIIDSAERMNAGAQNALLKTLEEPPIGTYFVLVVDDDVDLLDTIRSRCTTMRFDSAGAPLVDADTAARRNVWLSIPNRLQTASDALDIAQEVAESVASALKTREQAQADELALLAETIGERRGTAVMRTAMTQRFKRELRRLETEILAEALDVLSSFYRDVAAARRGSATNVLINSSAVEWIEEWRNLDVEESALIHVAEQFLTAQGSLEKNANPALVIENVLLRAATALRPPAA